MNKFLKNLAGLFIVFTVVLSLNFSLITSPAFAQTLNDGYLLITVENQAESYTTETKTNNKASDTTNHRERTIPSNEESEAIRRKIPNQSSQCSRICQNLQNTVDQLQDATGKDEQRLLAQLRRIETQIHQFNCRCLLQ